jgi:sulfoxide reductase heme-binding subunit YedZ
MQPGGALTRAFGRAFALALLLGLLQVTAAGAAGPAASATPVLQPSLTLPFNATFQVSQSAGGSNQSLATIQGSTQGTLPMNFQVQMTPAQFAGFTRGGAREVLLKGTVTFQDPQGGATWFQGPAQATLNANGTGDFAVVAPGAGPYQGATLTLESNYTVDSSGAMTGQLTGGMSGTLAATPAAPPVNHTYWYLSRAAGMIAYLLLFGSVVLGLAVKTKAGDWMLGRWRVYDLHQTAALTAMAFLLLHIFSLLGDQYIGFTVSQLLLPFEAPYRMLPVAAGIFGFYLLVVLTGSFYVRRWIGYGTWRSLHYLTFLAFGLGLLHGILSGTDSGQWWARDMYWITGAIVAVFTIYRMPSSSADSSSGTPPRRSERDRAAATRRASPATTRR